MTASKPPLRAQFRQKLRALSSPEIAARNRALGEALLKFSAEFPAGALVATYRARPKEASAEVLWGRPFHFCFPRVLPDAEGVLEFCQVARPADEAQFAPGFKGILEPVASCPLVQASQIAVCLVPLLAFDNGGGRLGHGGGYYDRFLEGFRGWKVGLAFECQRSAVSLPAGPHDQRLHAVVTEAGLQRFPPF